MTDEKTFNMFLQFAPGFGHSERSYALAMVWRDEFWGEADS